jgi:hypothetical protein
VSQLAILAGIVSRSYVQDCRITLPVRFSFSQSGDWVYEGRIPLSTGWFFQPLS